MPLSDLHDLDGDEEAQRDRYRELLEELRTVLPGVQVLLAFLLAVPFTERFGEVDDLGRNVFAGVILGVALTIVTFLTPAAYHRVGDRRDRAERLRTSARLAVTGLCLLGASMVAVLFVVVRFVFDSTVLGLAFAAALGLAVGALWFFLPVRRAHQQAARRPSPSVGDGD